MLLVFFVLALLSSFVHLCHPPSHGVESARNHIDLCGRPPVLSQRPKVTQSNVRVCFFLPLSVHVCLYVYVFVCVQCLFLSVCVCQWLSVCPSLQLLKSRSLTLVCVSTFASRLRLVPQGLPLRLGAAVFPHLDLGGGSGVGGGGACLQSVARDLGGTGACGPAGGRVCSRQKKKKKRQEVLKQSQYSCW